MGATSRTTLARQAQESIAEVFDLLGGTQALFEWAQRNPSKFYLFLWPRLLPKEVKAEVTTNTSGVVLQAVTVTDAREALNVLERVRYAGDAHSGCGGDGDAGEMVRPLEAHALCVSEPDGSGVGAEAAADHSDAA